jgi:23S rRNA (adenine2030-N6)-methyltransferase
MNYRHAYHAGNFADAHKHAALTLLLDHLRKKDTAFQVIDCHAGIGFYDLGGTEAGKTLEFQSGIGRLLESTDPALQNYLDAVRRENPHGLRHYPGSPRLIREALRPIDRLSLVELHPEDARLLRDLFRRDRQVAIREEDAYQALKALLPPKERRGLVLIDPPYEAKNEFELVVAGLGEALRRWPTGIYAIWYPIKAGDAHERFKHELVKFALPCLTSELIMSDKSDDTRLLGSGLALINPPWQSDQHLTAQLMALHQALDCRGETGLRWLVTP